MHPVSALNSVSRNLVHVRLSVWQCVAVCLLAGGVGSWAAPILDESTPGILVLKSGTCTSRWSAGDGALLSVEAPDGGVVQGSSPAWAAVYEDGSRMDSDAFLSAETAGTFSRNWDGKGVLTFHYQNRDTEFEIRIFPYETHIDVRCAILRTAGSLVKFEFPSRLGFNPDDISRVIFPQRGNTSLGLRLNRAFFQEHGEERAASYTQARLSTEPYRMLFGAELNQIEDSPDACALTVTPEGERWLSRRTVSAIGKRPMVINRAPLPGQMGIVLVDSPNGPALCATQFGGKGYLLRFTGKTASRDEADQRLQVSMILDALEGLVRRDRSILSGRRAAVIDLRNGPPAGGWSSTPVRTWRQAVQTSRPLSGSLGVAVLTTPVEVRQAMRSSEFAVILNPYGEWLPTGTAATWKEDIAALRDYVKSGGVWVEVAGYPFYYVLEPVIWQSIRENYPTAVADFVHIVGAARGLAVYGVQPVMDRPWQGREEQDRMLVPTYFETGGSATGGWFSHGWNQAIEPGMTWQSPVLRFVPGVDTPQLLADYAAATGLNRELEAKVKPEILAKLRRAVLVRLHEGTFARQTAAMDVLPPESLVHFTEYLHGGFDKQYPDHLPPRESWGTPEQLSEFYRRGHELGHLMMPYTNTSWWCIDPKGETFIREGDKPLAQRRDGSFYKERYSKNEGYTVCYWHPAVQEAHRRTRRQMSVEYPSDVLFQDQVGARGWRWDYNPASPCPTAGTDGLHSLSMEDSVSVPVATEDGYDRVAQFETMLCGMAWGTVPADGRHLSGHNRYRFAPGDWEFYPILGFLAHDKAIFTLHDLGHFVTDPERLSYCFALGYSLSYACTGDVVKNPSSLRWLFWLDALQKSICAEYTGQPLRSFDYPLRDTEHPARDRVMLSRFAGVTVVSNVSDTAVSLAQVPGIGELPARFDPWLRTLSLAGPGFLAWSETTVAGWIRHPDAEKGIGILVETVDNEPRYTFLAPAGAGVNVPGTGNESIDMGEYPAADNGVHARVSPVPAPGSDKVLGVALPRPGVSAAGDISRLLDNPAGRPPSAATVAVIAIPGAPASWTEVTSENWLKALAADPALQAAGLTVTSLTNAQELLAAITAPPESRPFAVLNPGGEIFYGPAGVSAEKMLGAIRTYVTTGGIWWETAGYSFHSYAAQKAREDGGSEWLRESTGPSGAAALSFRCAGYDVDEPPVPLQATADGLVWLGRERAARIATRCSGVQRVFTREADAFCVVEGGGEPFAAAVRCGGVGWLWRLGGFTPDPDASTEIVGGVLGYLASHPWPKTEHRGELRLWRSSR